jgi:BirA family biotin operon repressor/biotin-[acetyl-CoA-carboxylase] ligase
MAPADVLALSLLAGVAAAVAVEEVTKLKPDLRWPNDLLLNRTVPLGDGTQAMEQPKFCGILVEMNAEATRVRFAVVGIGLNVNQQSFPPDLTKIATSLRIETGRSWSRVQLTAALLQSFDREYQRMIGARSPADAREWLLRRFEQASSYVRGRHVHVDENGGYAGTTEGLDAYGFLRVRTDDGTVKTVLSGGVRAIGGTEDR